MDIYIMSMTSNLPTIIQHRTNHIRLNLLIHFIHILIHHVLLSLITTQDEDKTALRYMLNLLSISLGVSPSLYVFKLMSDRANIYIMGISSLQPILKSKPNDNSSSYFFNGYPHLQSSQLAGRELRT
jgi:hypothetical protein